ncbi:hypothetical protein BDV37DRAFT_286569 [Aspergillus pseudonomiae]|uniref:Uncharacterized protein n=1 Tax=Aspergillus pseudonomiae TaxID=1506151 RepID=A0A5N7D2D4_9EURO|nr:uncharacterized protein BDV37DRAFT_286569 [Aspergillus pseudonomiae]KAE8400565.1 hypothetical protein BDV37DRAFT_286569 [Aspergillus pseudonomiae]
MPLNAVRNLSSTAGRGILKRIGKVDIEDVRRMNGVEGDKWVTSVNKVRDDIEAQYDGVKEYEIQGARAHKSSKDPTDPDDVITIAFYSQNGTRQLSGHVHVDGTYNIAESRAGKGKGKGQGKK